MTPLHSLRRFGLLALGIGLISAAAEGRAQIEKIPYTLTIENNTELHLAVNVTPSGLSVPVHSFEVSPVSVAGQKFSISPGRMLVTLTPIRCGYTENLPAIHRETWVLPNQRAAYVVLKDSDFGKSVILPQCPERLADSPECARAKEEVARLDALRREPELLEGLGWALSDRLTLPESGGKMYDRIMTIKRELEQRRLANPAAPSMDPRYRDLVQEENRLNELYNARMTALMRQDEELAGRGITDVTTLTGRIQAARRTWQAEQHRYPHAAAERDRACAR